MMKRNAVTSDEMLRATPTDRLLAIARLALSPAALRKTPATIEATTGALAKQARLSIALIAALAGRTDAT